MTNARPRLTAGPPEDNLPQVVDAIQADIMLAFDRVQRHHTILDTRTALAIFLRQALDELASYWPEPDAELDLALFDLRWALVRHIRGDAKDSEVLRMAAQRIAEQAAELAQAEIHKPLRAAWGQNDLVRLEEWLASTSSDAPDIIEMTNAVNFTLADAIIGYAEHLRAEVASLREAREPVSHYDWSGMTMSKLAVADTPLAAAAIVSPPLTMAAAANGVSVAELEPETGEAPDWDFLSSTWASTPPEVLFAVGHLVAGEKAWRDYSTTTRLDIARHVIACLPAKKQKDYNALKPAWMPSATSLVMTLGESWADLVTMGSPWA